MRVKIQLMFDDGRVVVETVLNALHPGGWETLPSVGPVLEHGQQLHGFTYLPCPPPRDPEDVAACRALLARYFD